MSAGAIILWLVTNAGSIAGALQALLALVEKYKEIVDRSRSEGRPVSDEELAELQALRKDAVAEYEEAGQ